MPEIPDDLQRHPSGPQAADLVKLGVACLLGIATKEEIDSVVSGLTEGHDPVDPEVFEIFSKDPQQSRSRFVDYFRKLRPDFAIDSDEGVSACKELLVKQIERLHCRDITPFDFCNFVQVLEACYLDNAARTEGDVAYPDFLGDLWNVCDWCDESWTLENAESLRRESKRVAAEILAILPEGSD